MAERGRAGQLLGRSRELVPRVWRKLRHLVGQPQTREERRLASLRLRHVGRVGVIIGNGRSLRLEDLERTGSLVAFGCNRFHLAYEKTPFRPDYTVCVDPQMLEDFGEEIAARSAGETILGFDRAPLFAGDHHWVRLREREPFRFSANVYDHVAPGGSVVVAAIQLAWFMGIRHLYLSGIDHRFEYAVDPEAEIGRSAVGDGNHFIEGYRDGRPWCPPDVPRIEAALAACDRFLRARGGWVRNATRGGELEVCERCDPEEMFEAARAGLSPMRADGAAPRRAPDPPRS